MFEGISYISDHGAHVKVKAGSIKTNMINQHLVFVDNNRQVVSEVEYVHDDTIETRFIGEIINGKFQGGIIMKYPQTDSTAMVMYQPKIKKQKNTLYSDTCL